jgi:hypothetical protein
MYLHSTVVCLAGCISDQFTRQPPFEEVEQ